MLANESLCSSNALLVAEANSSSRIVFQAHAITVANAFRLLPFQIEVDNLSGVRFVPFLVGAFHGEADMNILGNAFSFFPEAKDCLRVLFGMGCQQLHAIRLAQLLRSNPIEFVFAHVESSAELFLTWRKFECEASSFLLFFNDLLFAI